MWELHDETDMPIHSKAKRGLLTWQRKESHRAYGRLKHRAHKDGPHSDVEFLNDQSVEHQV
jgi:hypothetical protein